MKCELCNKEKATRKHHLIPRNVLKKINPNSPLRNKTAMLCHRCEMDCHYGFLSFLIEAQQCDGYNRVDAIKYTLLKRFLKNLEPKVFHKWSIWFRRFLDNSFKEYVENNLKGKEVKK